MQRKKLATHEVFIEAEKRQVAITLLQEPYVGNGRDMRSRKGTRIVQCAKPGSGTVKAAIAVFTQEGITGFLPVLNLHSFLLVAIFAVEIRMFLN